MSHGPICTCQDCRDAALAEREAQEYDAWISHAVMVHRHLAVVLCGGCERPMETMVDHTTTPTTITTQHPCPCGWGKREESK